MTPKLEQIVARKRAEQSQKIPAAWRLKTVPPTHEAPNAVEYLKTCGILSEKELQITETTGWATLRSQLSSRTLSAVEVITAFAKRAAVTHQLTLCCTEMFFEDAISRARALDEHLERTGKVVGPLHGMPISIKDQFDIQGVDTSIGWAGLTGKPASKDSYTVGVVRELGAVPYVKSNIPQSMMVRFLAMSDSFNHVFGQCVNAWNRNLISGGSSGGEGTLVSARASLIGIGSDIGGSIRIPAGVCGTYGLCPTLGRQPFQPKGKRQEIVRPVAGPLATNVSTLQAYMKALASAEPWKRDPHCVPVPWREELCTIDRRLKIGYIVDDGHVKVQPPAARAVSEVVDKLRTAGHEVFEWDAKTHRYCYELWEKAILSDGGELCRNLCELTGEPLIQGMLVGTEADLMTTSETLQLVADKLVFETAYRERWTTSGIDAIIMPITPWVGYKPWTWVKSHQYVGYTSIWNFLNYASLAIPVTTVDASKDAVDGTWRSHTPRNDSDKFNHDQYDVNLVSGMPVGLQIVGGPFGDERTIAIAKVIESLLSRKDLQT